MITKIEWVKNNDGTQGVAWNPVTGCTPCSPGCENCYARSMANRLRGRYGYPADDPFRVTVHEDRLGDPLGWQKPRMVFICSMGDLFHEDVPEDCILRVFAAMAECGRHMFQVLTKRPERMAAVLDVWKKHPFMVLPNVWLGVTVCTTEEWPKIDVLRTIPAAVRFVSFEPLLEDMGSVNLDGIGWVIAGCERLSGGGPGRRAEVDWFRSLRDQCIEAGVPFFLKQAEIRAGAVVKMPILDGQVWDQMPEVPNADR